jgi:transposase
MFDCELVEKVIGITAPWSVTEVVINLAAREVVVKVVCTPTQWANKEGVLHVHGWQKRRWRHLDLWNLQTVIEAEVPRLKDPRTGTTEMAAVPWAEPHSRWSKEFEAHAVDVLLATPTLKAACKLLKVKWGASDAIMKRAVARGLERRGPLEVKLAGIDEKSFGRGQSYLSNMTDLAGRRILDVVEGADKEAVIALWKCLPEEQRAKVEAAAMDRGAAMIAGTEEVVPHVVIVHDKFHISQDQNKAVDEVRRAEHKKLMAEGDETLKGTKFLWLKGLERQSEADFMSFLDLVRLNLKTAKAWELKTTFEGFWNQPDAISGKAFFEKWFQRAVRSRMPEFVKLAHSLAGSLPRLLNYFTYRITNAMTEGFNSVVQQIKAAARGFRSFASYKARILFFCGDLALHPN